MIKYVLMLLGGYILYYLTIMIMDASKKKSKLMDSDNSLGSFDLTDTEVKGSWRKRKKNEEQTLLDELGSDENVPINIVGFDDDETFKEKVFESTATKEFSEQSKTRDSEDGYFPIPVQEANPFDQDEEDFVSDAERNKEEAEKMVEENNKVYEEVNKYSDGISYKKFYAFDARRFFDFDIAFQLNECKKVVVFAP